MFQLVDVTIREPVVRTTCTHTLLNTYYTAVVGDGLTSGNRGVGGGGGTEASARTHTARKHEHAR